jgi:hypothetical protein
MLKVNDKVLCYHGPFLYEATVRLPNTLLTSRSSKPRTGQARAQRESVLIIKCITKAGSERTSHILLLSFFTTSDIDLRGVVGTNGFLKIVCCLLRRTITLNNKNYGNSLIQFRHLHRKRKPVFQRRRRRRGVSLEKLPPRESNDQEITISRR